MPSDDSNETTAYWVDIKTPDDLGYFYDTVVAYKTNNPLLSDIPDSSLDPAFWQNKDTPGTLFGYVHAQSFNKPVFFAVYNKYSIGLNTNIIDQNMLRFSYDGDAPFLKMRAAMPEEKQSILQACKEGEAELEENFVDPPCDDDLFGVSCSCLFRTNARFLEALHQEMLPQTVLEPVRPKLTIKDRLLNVFFKNGL